MRAGKSLLRSQRRENRILREKSPDHEPRNRLLRRRRGDPGLLAPQSGFFSAVAFGRNSVWPALDDRPAERRNFPGGGYERWRNGSFLAASPCHVIRLARDDLGYVGMLVHRWRIF
jgi:hypothetical protein